MATKNFAGKHFSEWPEWLQKHGDCCYTCSRFELREDPYADCGWCAESNRLVYIDGKCSYHEP